MTDKQRERYSRHLILPGFGETCQEKLLSSKVLIVGAGGLGSPVALYLAAAGVGTIGIADGDVVSLSNLQRQVIHFAGDVGRQKVDSAAEKMRRINPQCDVVTYPYFIEDDNVDEIVASYDFVVEASDNAASRYRINDACVRQGKPFCIGGVSHFSGQLMTCVAGSATYRDLFAENEEHRDSPQPVFSPVVGILGTLMAAEAVKCLAGIGELLTNRLLTLDALTMEFNTYTIK